MLGTLSDSGFRHATEFTLEYYQQFRDQLDRIHYKGFANERPEIVAMLVQAAVQDYAATLIASQLDEIDGSLDDLACAIDPQGVRHVGGSHE